METEALLSVVQDKILDSVEFSRSGRPSVLPRTQIDIDSETLIDFISIPLVGRRETLNILMPITTYRSLDH